MNSYKIKILGVGGGGSNTVDYIKQSNTLNLDGIETYAINTDAQALEGSLADKKIHIGKVLTKGLGAGAIPNIGKKAAEESMQEIITELKGADIVFIASGMGGGTGTGAAPFIADIAKKLGILTIGIVTKPFNFEGPSRMSMAIEGLKRLEKSTDVTIIIPNEKLIENYQDKYIEEAFALPDEVLKRATDSIVRMLTSVTNVGIDIDLNSLRSTLKDQGLAVMGMGESNEKDLTSMENLIKALDNAVDSNILEISLYGAKRILILIGGAIETIMASEQEAIESYLTKKLNYDFKMAVGYKDEIDKPETYRSITIIATGYEDKQIIENVVKESNKAYNSNMFSQL